MAIIRSADQISIVDVTDAYSVILTSDSHTFPGSTNAALPGSVSTQVIVMQGTSIVAAKVNVSEISKPAGVSVTSNNDATSPTITITVTSAVTSAGVVIIPIHIGDVTINKEFTYAIAFQGVAGTPVTVTDTEVTYAVSTDITQPTDWEEAMPTADPGEYLWTKTLVTYSDGNTSTTYSYALQGTTGATGATGEAGTSVTVTSTEILYGESTSANTQPTDWVEEIPDVAEGEYLWTKTTVTYSDGNSTTTFTYAKQGARGEKGETGDAGADAITMTITSNNGTIFKNTAIATVLTAHVYKAGVELTETEINALGTINWYKDGSDTVYATGVSLTIDSGEVANKATFIAQLEG